MYSRLFLPVLLAALFSPAMAVPLEGIVVDATQSPVPGATVQLIPDHPAYLVEEEIGPHVQATTGADGLFRFEAPDSGTWALAAHAPGLRFAKFPLNVQAAASRRIGLRLEPGTAVQGRVLSADGEPIANAVLGPLRAGVEVEPTLAARVVPQWVRSDAEGRFAFAPAQPNISYNFAVQAPGYETAWIRTEVGESEVQFQLRPGGHRLHGSLFATDRPASTFSGAHVEVSGESLTLVARANERSEFEWQGLPPGQYSLRAIFSEPRAARGPQVELPRDEGTSIGVQVTSGYYVRGRAMDAETSTPAVGAAIRIRDVVTTSGAAGFFAVGPFYESFQVVAEVLEESGYAIANPEAAQELPMSDGFADVTDLEVQVRSRRILKVTIPNAELATQTVTLNLLNPFRRPYRTRLTSTTVDVPVYHAGDYLVFATSGAFATEATTVTITKAPVLITLTLAQAAGIEGSVLVPDSPTTSSQGWTVRLLTSDVATSAVVLAEAQPAADGLFRFPSLPEGRFVAEAANKSATRRQVQPVSLRPGATQTVSFVFEAGKPFAGFVRDNEANPIPAVQITFGDGKGSFASVSAGDQGQFRADDLLTNEIVNVQVEHHGFEFYRRNSVPLPAENFAIVLSRKGVVRAKVQAPTSTRWKLLLMETKPWATGGYADQLMSNSVGQSSVDGGETAEFPVPASSRMRLVAISETGALAVSPPFGHQDVQGSNKEIVLIPGQQGTLFGSIGVAGASAEVTAWNTSLPEGMAKSEYQIQTNNGNYEIGALPPGDYLVLAAGENVHASAVNVELAANENKRVDLQAQTAATIQGRVMLAGDGVSRAQVELLSESNPDFKPRNATTDGQGVFVFQDMLPDRYSIRVRHQTSAGELKAQRSVLVAREGSPPAVLLDLTPVRPVLLTLPPGLAISPGSGISLVHTETREVIPARWVEGGLEAAAPAGKYEVWNEDAVAGTAEVEANGTGRLLAPQP